MIKIIVPLIRSKNADDWALDGTICPNLNRLLSKSDRIKTSVNGLAENLFGQFGIDCIESELPIAAVRYRGESAQIIEGGWLSIDPVHLRTDLNDSILYHSSQLKVTEAEAEALFLSLVEHFPDYHFKKTSPERWYLKIPQAGSLKVPSLDSLAGRYINAYLPDMLNERPYLMFLNEVQMLFFDHPVNFQRQQQGQLTINSIWPYGYGETPKQLKTNLLQIYSDEKLSKGLAALAGVEFHDLSELSLENQIGSDKAKLIPNTLVVMQSLYDLQMQDNRALYAQMLSQCDTSWFKFLHSALVKRLIDKLEIDFCTGLNFVITPNKLMRFWRRSAAINQIISL